MNLTAENHLAAVGLYGDPRRIQFGVPPQRALALLLHLENADRRLDADLVDHQGNAAEAEGGLLHSGRKLIQINGKKYEEQNLDRLFGIFPGTPARKDGWKCDNPGAT